MAESQRILRLQPFLAEATVRAVPDSSGGVRIEVETLDEIPTIFSMRFRGWNPTALRIGDGNVAGQGLLVAARGEHRLGYRGGATRSRRRRITEAVDRTKKGYHESGARALHHWLYIPFHPSERYPTPVPGPILLVKERRLSQWQRKAEAAE